MKLNRGLIIARAALATLVVVWLTFFLGMNALLGLGGMESIINGAQDDIEIRFDRAWSWWPGRVRVQELTIVGHDSAVEFFLEVQSAEVDVDVARLVAREFHVRSSVAKSWNATMLGSKPTIIPRGAYIAGAFRFDADDTSPAAAVISSVTAMPSWIASALDVNNPSGTVELALVPGGWVVRRAEFSAGLLEVLGHLRSNPRTDGMFLFSSGGLSAAARIGPQGVELELANPTELYYESARRLESGE